MAQRVLIPAKDHHLGVDSWWVTLKWVCPVCGEKRGKVQQSYSFDGKFKLFCDTWRNPCGHVDKYCNLREEAKTNGLNKELL